MSEPYLHTSEVLFEPGDKIHPISALEGMKSPYDGPNPHYSRDHVYMYRDSETPKDFRFRKGGGMTYEVEPTGDVEPDPEPFRGKGPTPGSYRSRDPLVVKRVVRSEWSDPAEHIPKALRGENWEPSEQPRGQHIGLLMQHFAAASRFYRFQGVGAPEGEHAYYRGLYLGPQDTSRRVMGPGPRVDDYEDVPVHHSTDPDEILGRIAEHTQRRRDRGDLAGPEHPRVPIFGGHWTQDARLAHKFSLDPQHGHYRDPRWSTRGPVLGAVIEAHSTEAPSKANWNEFESETAAPPRHSVTRAFLHVHRLDLSGKERHEFGSQHTLVGTHEIPLDMVKQAAAPGLPTDMHKVFEHKRLLADHLAEHHPDLLDAPAAMHDALHRAEHTGEGRGWGAQQRADQGLEFHEHHPLIDPSVSKDKRLSVEAATVSDIQGLLGPAAGPRRPSPFDETDEERKERIRQHQAHQEARPGLSPGDDISQHQMGREYPHTEWVPIHVAQRFRDHSGDQHHGSRDIVDDLTRQFKSGRGVTDPLMLLHHNEARVAHLGEGNHRLKAMENAGWTHVPMRVVRMYDGESKDYLHQPDKHIPLHWLGSHIGRTPEMAKPSEVLSFGSKQHPPMTKQAAQHPGPHYHGTSAELVSGDLIEPNTHPPTMPDPDIRGEQASEPRQHVHFSPRLQYVTEHYGPNVYEVEPTGDYTRDYEYDNRRMFKSPHPLKVVRQVSGGWGVTKQASSLSLENVISVAEETMERGGLEGKHWHLPTSAEYPKKFENPDYWKAMQPVHDFVHAALAHGGHPDPKSIRVANHDYGLEGAQAQTDGMNSIQVRDHTNDLTLLHEAAHVLHHTPEGPAGHTKEFADTLHGLYHHFISPEAADQFHRVVTMHPEYAGDHGDEDGASEPGPGHQSIGRRGGPLSFLRWVAGGKSRRRDRRQQGRPGEPGPVEPDASPVAGPLEPKPVSWHPKAVKDLKALGTPEQKQILAKIEDLRVSDPVALSQTHALYGDLRGWAATKASRGHRIIHQPTDDGGIYIGHVGLHEYGDANRRLKSSLLGSLEWTGLTPRKVG